MHGMYAALILVALCAACAPTAQAPTEETALTACTDPRPQACTREYRPACASRDTDIRCITTPCPSSEWKTYGNACEACADPKVFGHRPGACEAE